LFFNDVVHIKRSEVRIQSQKYEVFHSKIKSQSLKFNLT
jgi:hypothetical protein